MTDEERKLAKERERARRRAKWAAMTPEQKRAVWERTKAWRVATGFKQSHNVSREINSYAVGKYSRCGFRWNAHGGHGNARIDDRRREVYARMAKIENGWRKS